ncbi:YSIRK-type signal peptide-containing protein, partial [Gemella sp.]
MWYEYKNGEKVTRFSIRKYHFGAASVAVASLIFFGGGMSAKAENVPAAKDAQVEKTTESTSNDGEKSADDSEADKKKISVDVPAAALPTAKVDKAELNKLTIGLDKELRATDAEKISGIAKELEKVLKDAKELLEKDNATAEEVEKQVEELEKAKAKLDETVKAFDEKAKKEAEEKKAAEAEKASKEANAATEENKEAELPKKRGRKSNRTEAPAENADSSSTSADSSSTSADSSSASENNAKQLPTYTNGAKDSGTYALAEEMNKIATYLRKNGGDETKTALIKANSDKLNEKLGLADEDGRLSEEDFNKALQDLDYARATIEGFLADKENGGKTELPKPEAVLNREQEEEASEEQPTTIQPRSADNSGVRTRTTRAAGQDRAGTRSGIESANYDTKKGYFFESGQNDSPYRKYSYVFYSKGGVGNTYYEGGSIPEAYKNFHVTVRATKTGLLWDITVNGEHKTLGVNKFYFTLPQGQTLKSGSVSVQTFNRNGGTLIERPSVTSGEDELKNALANAFKNLPGDSPFRGAELKDVEKGTKDATNARISNVGTTAAQQFKVGTLNDIAREQTYGAGYLNRGFYNRQDIEPSDLQKYSNKKFDIIEKDVKDVYTFSLDSNDDHSYKISFETTGSNDVGNLTFASGLKRVENATRQLINQWYAKTPEESDDTDKFKFKISGNGYFKVDQHKAYVNFGTNYADGREIKKDGENKALNYPRYIDKPLDDGTKGVLTYSGNGSQDQAFNIDFTSYGEYSNQQGQQIEKQKGKAEANDRHQTFFVTDEDTGKKYNLTDANWQAKKQLTLDIISKPGVHNFLYRRVFPSDNSSDTGRLSFVTKPKTPTLEALTNKAEITTNVTASGGTEGYNMVLYRKLDNGNLEKVKMVKDGVEQDAVVKANAQGKATFTGVELAQGKYVVKTVVDDSWIDYDGTKKTTVESDNSTEMTATVGQKFTAKPVITQDVTDLSLAVKIGQENATKAVVRYTDTNNKEQNVTFVKGTDGNWSKETATANSGITVQSSSNGTAVVTLPNGTAKPASTIYAKQKVADKAYSDEVSKEVSQLRIGLASGFDPNAILRDKYKSIIPGRDISGTAIRFRAIGNTKITNIAVTGSEGLGITWTPSGVGTTNASITANKKGGLTREAAGGIHPLRVTVTTENGKSETFDTSIIVPPKAGTFETTNEQLKEQAAQKPTIKVKDLNTNLGFGNITSPELEWKAYLVKGGRDAEPDYQNYFFKSATDYTVLASSSITPDGKATFDASNYRQQSVGKDPLRVVTALVYKGTDTIFDKTVSPLSTSTVQATSQKEPFATKPELSTTSSGDVTVKIGQNGATAAFVTYETAQGRQPVILQKQNGTWTKFEGLGKTPATVVNAADGTATVTIPFGTALPGTEVNSQQRTNETDLSEPGRITVPRDTRVPEVKIATGNTAQTLSQSRTDSDNKEAVYEVVQGQPFSPVLKAWDNFERLTKFSIDNLPTGITATNANSNFNTTTKYSEQSPFNPTFTGSVPESTTPGVYTSVITVNDGTTGDKNYYFKYKVLPKAPTVTATTTQNRVLSNDTTLSGTGAAGATIKVTVANQVVAQNIQVGNDGRWTVNLTKGLNSNFSDQPQLVNKDSVTVTQTLNGVESPSASVTVAVGSTTIQPSEENANILYAGAKEVVVKTPHDAGMFYLRYTDKDTGATKDLGFKRTTINGPWTSVDSAQAEVKGTPTKDGFTETLTITMKKPIKVGTASTKTNISEGRYGTPADWQSINVTNDAPTLTGPEGNTKTIEKGGQLDLNTLVTVHDKEDDKKATLGNGVTKEIVSVNGVATTKTVNTNIPGSYVVRYKATDSQGSSSELDVTVKVKPQAPEVTAETNGDVTIRPATQDNVNTVSFTYTNAATTSTSRTVTANKTNSGWTLTNAPTDGVTIDATTGVVTIKDREIKDNSQITAKSVTTDNVESSEVQATAVVGDRVAPTFTFSEKYTEVVGGVRVVYVTPTEELNNNPITLGTVNDNSGELSEVALFQGDSRTTTLKYGLDYNKKDKTANGDVAAPYDIQLRGELPKLNPDTNRAWDPTRNNGDIITLYASATDAAGNQLKNISNTPTEPTRVVIRLLTQKDKYTPQISTQILNKDITAAGATVSEDEFANIKQQLDFTTEKGDVRIARNTTGLTVVRKDNGAIKRKENTDNYYVGATVTYPDGTSEDFEIPLDQGDRVAPTVKVNGVELKDNVNENPKFVVFRGATFNPTFEVNDNSGTTTYLKASNLPTGNEFIKDERMANRTTKQIDGDNIVPSTAALGEHEATVLVKDALNNEKEYKFKYIVADVESKIPEKTVEVNSRLGNAHDFVKAVVENNSEGDDKYYPRSMEFKWSKDNANVSNDTQLTTPGTVTYNAVADFYNQGGKYTNNIAGIGNGVTIYAPDKIERPVTFKVKPTAPRVTPANGDVTITPVKQANVDKFTFTYINSNESRPETKTVTATKTVVNGKDNWTLTGAPTDGVTVDAETGVVTIKDREVKDAASVTAKAVTTVATGSVESDTTTETTNSGERENPTFTFDENNTKLVNGERVVYVTPTESNNFKLGTFKDNSNKLIEAKLTGKLNEGFEYGLNYSGNLEKTPNTEESISSEGRDINITGMVPKLNRNRPWNNDTTIMTRYAVATDAAGNQLKDFENRASNPTRMVFKVLSQSEKYTPTITTQPLEKYITDTTKVTGDEFSAMKENLTFTSTKGNVNVTNKTPELTVAMKEDGLIKSKEDGSHYVGATVTYPDGTTKDFEIPVKSIKPAEPNVIPESNGDVTATPGNEPNIDKLEVTYTPVDNNQLQDDGTVTTTPQAETKVVATKDANNQWSITEGAKDGITIDPSTGKITLKDQVVKDGSNVTAKVSAQGIESDETMEQAATGDITLPVIGASSKLVEAGKEVNIPLNLTDDGVGIDESNIKVTNLPEGLRYDEASKSIKGTLKDVSKSDIKVAVLDKNGNKAEKTISLVAVKPKTIYAISGATIKNVDNAANFVEVPQGVTLTSATWKDDSKPTTEEVGRTTRTITANLDGYDSLELTTPVFVYPAVTLRKVNNQDVTTYYEVVGQPLTSAVWGTGGRTQPAKPDFYVAFEGDRPAGTTIEFEDGMPTNTTAGTITKKIIVTYPNGAGKFERELTFKTYGYEPNYPTGKDYFETEVGKAFANAGAGSYVKPSTNLTTPSRTYIGWGDGFGSSPVQRAQTTIGVREEQVNVHYGTKVESERGDETHRYTDQNIKVAVAVKPKAPTLQGQAGTKPAVTVSNLPESSQLAAGATVKVQLKDAQGVVVAEKDVPAGTTTVTFATTDYNKELTLGEQLNANVLVSGTYKKTEGSQKVDTPYNLTSADSNEVPVKTYADFYRDQVTYPTNEEKVTYADSDITNGNFTDAAKERFAAKLQEVNANNSNLPTGVTYTKGTTDDKAKVAVINFPDGSTIDISHTQVAKPTLPTFTPTEGQGEDGKLRDTDRTISGTALQSATKVTLELQTGTKIPITKDPSKTPETLAPGEGVLSDNGTWTYKLPNDTYLRQTDATAEPGSSSLPVKVTQTVFDAESDEASIFVANKRTVEGKTIEGVVGSEELNKYKTRPQDAVIYKEDGVPKDFPNDFVAQWEKEPTFDTVGTFKSKVKFFEKDGTTPTNRISEAVEVTFIVKSKAPAELTYTNKQNGETVVNIPEDADEVVFTVPTSDTNVNTITVRKADGWSANGIEKRGNTWVFPANSVQGKHQVTAVATAGSGDTKSATTPTSISAPAHTVTTNTITKAVGENPTNEELLAAVDVANKQSATLKEGTQYPTTVGRHTLDVVVTYADQSTENVKVSYVVNPVDKTALTNANNALETEATSVPDTADKPESKVTAYNEAKKAADKAVEDAKKVIANDNATPEAVQAEIAKVNAAKDALKKAEDAVTAAATTTAKNKLAEDKAKLDEAVSTEGKTPESIEAYNAAKKAAEAAVEEAKAAAKAALDKADNATAAEVQAAQEKVTAAQGELDKAKAKLVDKADKTALTNANNALETEATSVPDTADKPESKVTAYNEAKKAADK